jgi:hypothetical protein
LPPAEGGLPGRPSPPPRAAALFGRLPLVAVAALSALLGLLPLLLVAVDSGGA